MSLNDRFYTITEAAEDMGVTSQTIYKWIKNGKLETEKIGNTLLVDKISVFQHREDRISDMYFEAFNLRQISTNFKSIREFFGLLSDVKIELLYGKNRPVYLVTDEDELKYVIEVFKVNMEFNKDTGRFTSIINPIDTVMMPYENYMEDLSKSSEGIK